MKQGTIDGILKVKSESLYINTFKTGGENCSDYILSLNKRKKNNTHI